MGENEAAVEALKECISAEADYAMAHLRLGNIYLAAGKMDEAKAAYEKALESDPGYERAYYNLGIIADRSGDWSKAEELYKKAISANPGFDLSYFALGALYLEKRSEREKAGEYLRKFIDLSPEGTLAEKARRGLETIEKAEARE
jgi:tetratricopeptide (TPR) repeat protein